MQDWPATKCYQSAGILIWLAIAVCYNLVTLGSHGPRGADHWLVGYLQELVFSFENILIYELITLAFKTPRKAAKKAIFLVVCFQLCIQCLLFVGLAYWLQSLAFLPYLLGIWLIFVGYQAGFHEEESFHMEDSLALQMPKRWLGDRLVLNYDEDCIFTTRGGRTSMTMLGPVLISLMMVNVVMEADVTLTKIEVIEDHYVAFSSSVVAAFAVPELFFVVCSLMQRCPELRFGICFAVVYFGVELLLVDVVAVNALVGLGAVVVVMVLCVVYSEVKKLWLGVREDCCSGGLRAEGDCFEGDKWKGSFPKSPGTTEEDEDEDARAPAEARGAAVQA